MRDDIPDPPAGAQAGVVPRLGGQAAEQGGQVPALGGRTPRKAAAGPERPLLEALLRQFEYEADLLAADGKAGVDTAWLREQLDMTADPAD